MTDQLDKLFERYTGHKVEDRSELTSSGSHRRYFRLTGGNISLIGVIGTNLSENKAFCYLSAHFREKGIKAPKVFAKSDDGMCYIQEDLGNAQLYNVISQGRETGEYSSFESSILCHTIEMLPKIQFKGAQGLDYNCCFPEPEFNERKIGRAHV